MFYMAVTQAVLLFGSETRVILAVMERVVEGAHTGFLRKITGDRARKKTEGEWVNLRLKVQWKKTGVHGTMCCDVASFDVCARDLG